MQAVIELFLSLIGEASTGRTKPIVPWLDKAIWLVLGAILLAFVVAEASVDLILSLSKDEGVARCLHSLDLVVRGYAALRTSP